MTDGPEIRPVEPGDREGWLSLWRGYHDFYRSDLPNDVTDQTFSRLCESRDGFGRRVGVGSRAG